MTTTTAAKRHPAPHAARVRMVVATSDDTGVYVEVVDRGDAVFAYTFGNHGSDDYLRELARVGENAAHTLYTQPQVGDHAALDEQVRHGRAAAAALRFRFGHRRALDAAARNPRRA